MNRDNFLNSLAAVWNLFFRFKLKTEEEPKLWLSPAAGMITGAVAAVIGSSLVHLTGPVSGGIMAAIFLPLSYELLTGWRGPDVSVSFLDRTLSGRMDHGNAGFSGNAMQSRVLFASVYLFRMAVFGLLAGKGNAVWYVYALGGAFLIRGELLAGDTEEDRRCRSWILYAAGSFLAAVLAFHGSAFTALPIVIAVTALLLLGSRRYSGADRNTPDLRTVELFGYLSENLLLAMGLILSGGY